MLQIDLFKNVQIMSKELCLNRKVINFVSAKNKLLFSQQNTNSALCHLSWFILICVTSTVRASMVKLMEHIHNGSYSLARDGGVFTPEGYFL